MQPELERLLRQLRAARLRRSDWARAAELLDDLRDGDGDGDGDGATAELHRVVFEGQVHGRFSGGRSAAGLEPTKQTSALPWVGLACGGSLIGVGVLLGGGVILVGIVALGLFVFGVAMAGSRVAHRGPAEHDVPETDRPVGLPPEVAERIVALEASRSRDP